MRRWEPMSEITPLREAMDRLFEQSFLRPMFPSIRSMEVLPIDMYQTDSEVVIKAAVPGIRPEDIDIKIVGDTISISGESKMQLETKEENYMLQEMSIGKFHREVMSPVALKSEQAQANFENGVLTIKIPKAESVKTKQVKVQVKQSDIR
jgi:HSP20 family protein